MTEEEIKKLTSEHRERNRELGAHFKAHDVDLLVARPIEFHFWAWNQRDAAVLARGLYEMGFLIRLLAPAPTGDDADRWTVEAGAKIPLEQALGEGLTDKLIRLAGQDDAVFDGWGTNV
jgi:regulator of ribonuclease activity B